MSFAEEGIASVVEIRQSRDGSHSRREPASFVHLMMSRWAFLHGKLASLHVLRECFVVSRSSHWVAAAASRPVSWNGKRLGLVDLKLWPIF